MKLVIGNDHAGFEYKEYFKTMLEGDGHEIKDFGTTNKDSVDYPDYVHPLAKYMREHPDSIGIIICGSGNGVAMTANKHQHLRAALCWSREITVLARKHNNANVISIPARFVSKELALNMILDFINTSFEGGRHERRVNKIPCN